MKKIKKNSLLNAAVVGCGGIAQVIHLPLLTKHPDLQVRAICDVDNSKAAIIADKFQIPRVYVDIADLLTHEDIDVVFILTPNNLHLPMSLISLEHGAHLFIEKPAARNGEEVLRIKKKAEEVGKEVMVGMQNRFRNDVIALRRFIEGEELGNLFFVKGAWLHAQHQSVKQAWLFQKNVSGGGVVMDLGVQMLDLAWWLLGKPVPKVVKSFAYKINPNLSVEDFCVSCITFENNLSFSLEISWDFPIPEDHFSLEIIGEKGIGTLNPVKLQKMMHGQMMNITPEIRESKISSFKLGYQNEVSHFIDYLTGRVDHLESTIDDALLVYKMVDGIYQSMEVKHEVQIK